MSAPLPFQNPLLSFDQRADDLVSRMTLAEKIGQMTHSAPAIPRLGVPAYNWWNECLHGVARNGKATVFPQAIGMAATWNTALIKKMGDAVSDEARAKFHDAFRTKGATGIYEGLTYWTPNINIFRDPRWGRGQETYGECPFLTARIAIAYIKGLQGDNAKYLKLVATAKHFAAYSGPEARRHDFDAVVSKRDLADTYLPHFEACVREAKVESIMTTYTRVNGEPTAGHDYLLNRKLRAEWGFDGYVVSDCWAVEDIWKRHKCIETPEQAVAWCVKNGGDLNCGVEYPHLMKSYDKGLIDESVIDRSVKRLVVARMRLGLFDSDKDVPFASIPMNVVESDENVALSREVARQSIVLLKNENNLLPLNLKKLKRIAVIGPNAADYRALLGNYHGAASQFVTPLDGIRNAATSAGIDVEYVQGCDILDKQHYPVAGFQPAIEAAKRADVAILFMGMSPRFEGEEGEVHRGDDWNGDRPHIYLPKEQDELIREIVATGTPVVLALMTGSAIAIPWAAAHVPAIINAWYPGQQGGDAIADVLFGKANPAGRLPVTFYRSMADLPAFDNYSMDGRTYRYFDGEPLYPFGYGLSYSRFEYSDLKISEAAKIETNGLTGSVHIKNTGSVVGDEVAQAYIVWKDAAAPGPRRQLIAFERISLAPGESKVVRFSATADAFAVSDDEGVRSIRRGELTLTVSGYQPEVCSSLPTCSNCVEKTIEISNVHPKRMH